MIQPAESCSLRQGTVQVAEVEARLEDLYLAEEELRAIRAGARTYPLEELRNALGLED